MRRVCPALVCTSTESAEESEPRPSSPGFHNVPEAVFAMADIFNKICILVTTAFALTLVPGFGRSERSPVSMGNKAAQLLVFLLLGLVEEVTVGRTGWFNHRIVAVCAAGLLAGPRGGLIVGVFVTWLAVAHGGGP